MLAIGQLSYRYAGAASRALSEVSLQVGRGEVFGLLGPNGAGKTTLLAHLAGLATIQQGSITLDGESLTELRRREPTRTTLAPQEYAFYPMLSVRENLDCFAGACRLSAAAARVAIERALAVAQLDAFLDVRAEHLSGGLRRRLNLAIALLPSPALLLLDEPTVGVDPQSRAFLLQIVRQLASDGMTVIYTSHYMEEIESIADRVAILDHGQVLCAGTLGELLGETAGGSAARRLELRVAPEFRDAVARRLAVFGPVDQPADRLVVELPADRLPYAALLELEQAGLPVEQMSFGRRTLEDLFMQLTQRSLRD